MPQNIDSTAVRENNLSRENGAISRAALVRQTGLSATTISFMANDLLASGFVHESGLGQSQGGRPPILRPPILLEFNYKFRHIIGLSFSERPGSRQERNHCQFLLIKPGSSRR